MSISPKIDTYGRDCGSSDRLTVVPSGSWCSWPMSPFPRQSTSNCKALCPACKKIFRRLALDLVDRRVIPDGISDDRDDLVDDLM